MKAEENFISFELAAVAAERMGLLPSMFGLSLRETHARLRGESRRFPFNVKDVVGPMTGLDMRKYDLVKDVNLCGWRLVRKVE